MDFLNLEKHKLNFRLMVTPLHEWDEFETVKTEYNLIDATNGGLVLGNPHSKGGVKFLSPSEDGFRIFEMEGFEYLINKKALNTFEERILTINKYYDPFGFEEYQPSAKIRVINTFDLYDGRLIILKLSDRQFVVNKYATKKHLEELDYKNYLGINRM